MAVAASVPDHHPADGDQTSDAGDDDDAAGPATTSPGADRADRRHRAHSQQVIVGDDDGGGLGDRDTEAGFFVDGSTFVREDVDRRHDLRVEQLPRLFLQAVRLGSEPWDRVWLRVVLVRGRRGPPR